MCHIQNFFSTTLISYIVKPLYSCEIKNLLRVECIIYNCINLDEYSDDELLNYLPQVRDNIEMNSEAGMTKSMMINMDDEREIIQEIEKRGLDYDDEWSPQ